MGERGNIMQIGSIVRSVHIAVPQGARGIVMRILGDMAMVAWYAGEPGASSQLNTEPFFLEDLIDTANSCVRRARRCIESSLRSTCLSVVRRATSGVVSRDPRL